VTDALDPRLADYRHLKDRDLSAQGGGGRFVAESERVVRRLLGSGLGVHSVLVTPARLGSLGQELDGQATSSLASRLESNLQFPVYVAAQSLLNEIAGFPVHRGCLAVGQRPPPAPLPGNARAVVILEDLVDADNLGASVRNAAAFGVDALLLSPRCADPFYRKAIRVAIGATFGLPILRLGHWPQDLMTLKRGGGFTLLGAVLGAPATPLSAVGRPAKFALLLGSEGPGLSAGARLACDQLVTIPMAPGADSLNVATAGAVALFHLQQGKSPVAAPRPEDRG